MEPIQAELAGAVARLIEGAPNSRAKIDLAWRVAVGAPLARATSVELSDGGTLRVRVDGPIWRRELQRSRALVLARLQKLLGEHTVTHLDLVPSP